MNFKNFGLGDIALTKSAVFLGALFLFSAWPGFANWVTSIHWAWFLVIALVLAIKPLKTTFKK